MDCVSNKDLLIRRESRINNIYNRLKSIIDNDNIDNILESIENLI